MKSRCAMPSDITLGGAIKRNDLIAYEAAATTSLYELSLSLLLLLLSKTLRIFLVSF